MGAFYAWFADRPAAYDGIAVAATFVFLGLAVRGAPVRARFFVPAVVGTFVAWRWAAIVFAYSLNPDEAQMIANAIKATVDIVPWRGIDGATMGPLDSDVLALPWLIGMRIGYLSTRVIEAALELGTIIAVYCAGRWTYGERTARLALIPLVLLCATVTSTDFQHYTSEVLPLFLAMCALAACAYLMRGGRPPRGRTVAIAVAGSALGCVPFAKLQGIPLMVPLLAYLAFAIVRSAGRRRREAITAAAAVLAPAVIVVGAVLVTGNWYDAVVSYILWPSSYVEAAAGRTFDLVRLAQTVPSFAVFASLAVVAAALALGAAVAARVRPTVPELAATASAVLLVAVGAVCVVVPHREFPHYLHFLVFPLAWLVTNAVGLARRALRARRRGDRIERVAGAAFAAVFAAAMIAVALVQPTILVPALRYDTPPPSAVASAISRYAPPGDTLLVWGWMAQYFIDTDTVVTGRDANSAREHDVGPYRDYFRARYLRDLEASPPHVFVDAVAPGSFGYTDRTTEGFETFPELARFIGAHYVLRADVGGVRVFVRARSDSVSRARAAPP